jgi:hypothetical protein
MKILVEVEAECRRDAVIVLRRAVADVFRRMELGQKVEHDLGVYRVLVNEEIPPERWNLTNPTLGEAAAQAGS